MKVPITFKDLLEISPKLKAQLLTKLKRPYNGSPIKYFEVFSIGLPVNAVPSCLITINGMIFKTLIDGGASHLPKDN